MELSLSIQAEETVPKNEPITLSKQAEIRAAIQAEIQTQAEVQTQTQVQTQILTPVLDGKLDEWQASTALNSVVTNQLVHKNNYLDWQQTWLAHDNDNLYIAYHNKGSIPKNDWWAWEIYLDVDHNPKTGYRAFNHLGADYLLQGNELYQYVGSTQKDKDQDWDKIWKYIGYAQGQIDTATGMNVELSIPLKWLKLSTEQALTLNVLFYGDNEVFGGKGEDRHQGIEGYFSYAINAIPTKK